jgi:hypothetical protein
MRNSLIFWALLVGISPLSLAKTPMTVVELFTSQGCYSCPPADDLLGELKQRPDVIALACHVTYWNYLGWRDTFSDTFCDNRQRRYQSVLRGNQGVYTPQMVINGRYGLVGSRKGQVEQVIQQTNKPLAFIDLRLKGDDTLQIKLPSLPESSGRQRVFLFGSSGLHYLPIARGENGGKKLYYHNPIERIVDLGSWEGQEVSLSQPLISAENNDAPSSKIREWVVIAQSWPLGKITAAGKLLIQ